MRIALAGFSQGYYAVEYTRYLSRLKEIDIAAVCDLGESEAYVRSCAFVNAEDFAWEMDAPLVHTMDALLACSPDAVLVCAETVQHTALARQALEAGAWVFVSKPLCFSSAQADELAGLPRSNRILCGHPLRHEAGVRELISRLPEIGRPYSVRIRLCHAAMIHQQWERDSGRSGGPLGTYGVYLFDLARALGGTDIRTLYAVGANACTPQIEDMDTVKILGQGGGVQYALELFSAVDAPMPFFQAEVVGEKGMLMTQYDNAVTIGAFPGGARRTGELRTSSMTAGEMDHFLAVIDGQSAPVCDVRSMQYVARCIEAARESMAMCRPAAVRGGMTA